MKKKLALIFAFALSSGTAQADSLTAKEVEDINDALCVNLSHADNTGFRPERFKRIILEGIGVSESSPDANKAVSRYLNDNKNNIICLVHSLLTNPEKLYTKKAIQDGVIDLFDEILLDDELYEIDFNGYEIVDGKKETILDWIDIALEMPGQDRAELLSIEEVIVDLGGKRGSEL